MSRLCPETIFESILAGNQGVEFSIPSSSGTMAGVPGSRSQAMGSCGARLLRFAAKRLGSKSNKNMFLLASRLGFGQTP